MNIRLYFDEDSMSQALVQALRLRQVDVATALDAGMIQMEDEDHLKYAAQQGRALYSFNVRDFHKLHIGYLSEGKSHAGIILAPQQRYSVGEQMRALLRLSAVKSAEDMQNQLEFLSLWT